MSAIRYVFLDGLRGLAALSIVVHHFTADIGHGEVFASAAIAVDFFFCLSGFVIAHAYHHRLLGGMSLATYGAKRLSRLYPMYFMGTLIGLAALLLLKERGLTSFTYHGIFTSAALNLFYIPYFNNEHVFAFVYRLTGTIFPLNNPAWSLFYGILANLAYAISLRTWRHAPLMIAALSGVALWLLMPLYGEAPGWGSRNFPGGLPRVMYAFFAGVVAFQLHARSRPLPGLAGLAIVAVIVTLVAIPRFAGHRYYWLIAALAVVPFVVSLGAHVQVRDGTRWSRVCTYSGGISYPIFCVHYPLLLLFSLLPRDEGHLELFSLHFVDLLAISSAYFATVIVVAHVLMTRIEEPMRARLAAWLRGANGARPEGGGA